MTPRQYGVAQVGPWFRRRRWSAVSVAVVITAAVWLVGLVVPGDRTALSIMFALPLALLAVTFGAKGGLAAGAAAILLSVAWAAVSGHPSLDAGEWAAGTALLVLGVLLGEAVDALAAGERIARQADQAQRRLAQAAEHRREAADVNDTLVQGAAMAKWALEAGNVKRAIEILEETIECGQRLVTTLINASDDDMTPGVEVTPSPGLLTAASVRGVKGAGRQLG